MKSRCTLKFRFSLVTDLFIQLRIFLHLDVPPGKKSVVSCFTPQKKSSWCSVPAECSRTQAEMQPNHAVLLLCCFIIAYCYHFWGRLTVGTFSVRLCGNETRLAKIRGWGRWHFKLLLLRENPAPSGNVAASCLKCEWWAPDPEVIILSCSTVFTYANLH